MHDLPSPEELNQWFLPFTPKKPKSKEDLEIETLLKVVTKQRRIEKYKTYVIIILMMYLMLHLLI